jgi:hypothetical protein
MCKLYSLTKGQQAIRELTRAMRDSTDNLPSLPGIYPDFDFGQFAKQGKRKQ